MFENCIYIRISALLLVITYFVINYTLRILDKNAAKAHTFCFSYKSRNTVLFLLFIYTTDRHTAI